MVSRTINKALSTFTCEWAGSESILSKIVLILLHTSLDYFSKESIPFFERTPWIISHSNWISKADPTNTTYVRALPQKTYTNTIPSR